MTARRKKETEPAFEVALERLEEIVEQIEREELELDRSLDLFEEGIALLRIAEARLAGAEQRVQQLVEDARGTRIEEWSGES
jgi:exodeoxyribonuclease VII small subunit